MFVRYLIFAFFLNFFVFSCVADDSDDVPSLQKQDWANLPACGIYSNSSISHVRGNEGLKFSTVKIFTENLSGPPYTQDDTMSTGVSCAFSLMSEAAAASGIRLTIDSAFRSLERQEYFWHCYQTKSCNDGNLAAKPGSSNHGYALALDLNCADGDSPQYAWMKSNGAKFGFVRTVPTENWHW